MKDILQNQLPLDLLMDKSETPDSLRRVITDVSIQDNILAYDLLQKNFNSRKTQAIADIMLRDPKSKMINYITNEHATLQTEKIAILNKLGLNHEAIYDPKLTLTQLTILENVHRNGKSIDSLINLNTQEQLRKAKELIHG